MPLQPGQTLSHYRIERKIGQGGPISTETGETFRSGTPVQLFPSKARMFGGDQSVYDVAADGQSFVFLEMIEESGTTKTGVTLVQNWPALLR